MPKPSLLLVLLFLPASAFAEPMPWEGYLWLTGLYSEPLLTTGTGVAEVGHIDGNLTQIDLYAQSQSLSGSITIPLTDPDNATLVTLVASVFIAEAHLKENQTTKWWMPVGGTARLCVVFPGCAATVPLPLTINGSIGIGLGGVITVNTFALSGNRVSLRGAPWTLGVATATDSQGETYRVQGRVRGPDYGPSSTAQPGGVLQWVTPYEIRTNAGISVGFGTFQMKFIPEPSQMLLLTAGCVGLYVLGMVRCRR